MTNLKCIDVHDIIDELFKGLSDGYSVEVLVKLVKKSKKVFFIGNFHKLIVLVEDASTIEKLIDMIKEKLRDEDKDVRGASLQACIEFATDGKIVHSLSESVN